MSGLLGRILEPNPNGGLLDFAMNLAQQGGAGAPTMAGLAGAGQATRQNMLQAREYQREQAQRLIKDKAISQITDEDLKMLAQLDPSGELVAQVMAARMKASYGGENTPDVQQLYRAAVEDGSWDPKRDGGLYQFIEKYQNRYGGPNFIMTEDGPRMIQAGSKLPPVTRGAPGTPMQYDPNQQGQIASAEGYGSTAGSGAAKRVLDQPQARASVAGVTQQFSRFRSQVQELRDSPGLDNITGYIAGRTPTLSQDGRNAQELLNGIKNQTFINALQAMRDASKTGGAVGNVSDKEGDRLENAWVALGQSQDTETYKRRLNDLIRIADEGIANIERAYNDQYPGQTPPTMLQRPAGAVPTFDAEKERRYQEWKRRQQGVGQ